MSTEYTTVQCFQCGDTVPGNQVHQCRAILTLTEARVRELAREEIRAHGAEANTVEIERRVAEKNARIRDAALEEAAQIAHSWNPTHVQKAADEIRSLKSKAAGGAAQENDTMRWMLDRCRAVPDTSPMQPATSGGGVAYPKQPTDPGDDLAWQAYNAQWWLAYQSNARNEIATLRRELDEALRGAAHSLKCAEAFQAERDTLRSRLEAAEKAIEKIRAASKMILSPMCNNSVRARHYMDILDELNRLGGGGGR